MSRKVTAGLAVVALWALANACSTSTPTPADAGNSPDSGNAVPDAGPVDAGPQGDGGFYDFACGYNTPCPSNTVCCAAPDGGSIKFSCVDPATCVTALQITCDGPDECTNGAAPLCCAVEIPNGLGTYPQCQAASLGTSCQATCPTHLAQTCTETTKVVICHVGADCTDATNNNCCTFVTDGGASLTFCTDALTSLGAVSCH